MSFKNKSVSIVQGVHAVAISSYCSHGYPLSQIFLMTNRVNSRSTGLIGRLTKGQASERGYVGALYSAQSARWFSDDGSHKDGGVGRIWR